MNNPLLQIKNGSFSISNKLIFSDLNLKISPNDRICLIGRNGCGKSSLMKIITSIYELDKGEIITQKNLEIGYLPQSMEKVYDETIYDFVLRMVKLEDDETEDDKRYLADIVLDNLKLDGKENMRYLSGGKLRRAHLAKCLILKPDLLLLDEPTNHLDIVSIEWLEDYIKSYSGGILCVSHDKAFLSNATNKTIWLDRGKMRFHHQGFADFESWSEQISLEEEAKIQKLSRKLEEETGWLHGGVTGRRKRNQHRLSNLYNLRKKISEEKNKLNILSNKIKLPDLSPSAASKLVLEMENVSFSYDKVNNLLESFSIRVNKGEKIGVIGANGSGKTSFIKLITGELKPDKGYVKLGANAQISYFDQKRESLDKDKTLWQTMCPEGGDMVSIGNKTRHVVAYLKDFLFDSKQVKDKVEFLSGGEANRLLLAKTLANPGTLLILDEPTNDLDMDSLEILLEILTEFKGTLIIVSHDRDFLDQLVTQSLIFTPNGIMENVGGYKDYKQFMKQDSKKADKDKNRVVQNILPNSQKNNVKLSYKLQYELDQLPQQLELLSKQLTDLESDLSLNQQKYEDNSYLLQEILEKISEVRKNLEEKENRWIELETLKSSS